MPNFRLLDPFGIFILTFIYLCSFNDVTVSSPYRYEDMGKFVVADTEYGPVKGLSIRSQYEHKPQLRINMFLGIPYAKRIEQYSDWRREFRFRVRTFRVVIKKIRNCLCW